MKTFFGAMMLAVPLLITAGQAYAQKPHQLVYAVMASSNGFQAVLLTAASVEDN